MKPQSSTYWNKVEVRTSTSIVLLKVMLWNSLFDKFVILHKASILLQAPKCGLVTPEPFSFCELRGVWARDYILILYSLVSFPDHLEKQKGGSGKWVVGVEVYTAEFSTMKQITTTVEILCMHPHMHTPTHTHTHAHTQHTLTHTLGMLECCISDRTVHSRLIPFPWPRTVRPFVTETVCLKKTGIPPEEKENQHTRCVCVCGWLEDYWYVAY